MAALHLLHWYKYVRKHTSLAKKRNRTMSNTRKRKRTSRNDQPAEIPMTDLGLNEEGEPEAQGESNTNSHAVGTPGGGAASGGLAGTNIGAGDPENADLEAEMGSGIAEQEENEDKGGPPFAGPGGGAVGGTPAEGRAKGGRVRHGIAPGGVHRGDSTIGSKDRKGRK
jgi:hypothetical protein